MSCCACKSDSMFSTINRIVVDEQQSWKDKLFLTFDLDWCSDAVLDTVINMVEEAGIAATWFITHETRLLDRLRANADFELGIHPNFNPLLEGNTCYGKTIHEVVAHYKAIVPEAVSVRSHSMTQSSRILDAFEGNGLRYDCNTFVPHASGILLKPWYHWTSELIKVPYFWEDDVHCIHEHDWGIERYMLSSGLRVFDFHPIHVFLNTEHLDRYEDSRTSHHDISELNGHVNEHGFGTRDFLTRLIQRAS